MTAHRPKNISFKVKGAIFDVDDTLLNNDPEGSGMGLHEQSRLAAAREIGRRHDIPVLRDLSPRTNYEAFAHSPVHGLEGAVWNTFVLTGLRDSPEIDHDDPLLREIMEFKNHAHEEILRRQGQPLPGAVAFVRALAAAGMADKLAIASSSIRRDIDIFFEMSGLDAFFPPGRIISKEAITRLKPDPQGFNMAFATLGLTETDRAQVCAFEDDPRGIKAAHEAGLYVCGITTRYTREILAALAVPPHCIADSYREFADFFGVTLR